MNKPAAGFKCGVVALAGPPNAGKSSLLNRLMGQKLAAAAPRPQTTRFQVRGVLDLPLAAQIVFVDTAGLLDPSNAMERGMRRQSEDSVREADQVLWLCSPELERPLPPPGLSLPRGKSQIVLNKIDAFSKARVEKLAALLAENFPGVPLRRISVKKKKGINELVQSLVEALPEAPPLFGADEYTDQSLRQIAAEMIREKALIFTRDEVPHGIAVKIEEYKERPDGLHDITATLMVEREGQKGIVIGKGGQMLKKIGTSARKELERAADARVNLKLWVKVVPDWKKKPAVLKDLGYPHEGKRG